MRNLFRDIIRWFGWRPFKIESANTLKEINGQLIFGDNSRTTARSIVVEFSEPIDYRAFVKLVNDNTDILTGADFIQILVAGNDNEVFDKPEVK